MVRDKPITRHFLALLTCCTLVGAVPWVLPQATLIADRVAVGNGEPFLLGVRIPLGDEWKTFWRHPGESGLPPTFDWSQSENLAQAHILYPEPEHFTFEGITSIGYSQEVVFPVRVVPKDPSRPLQVHLNLSYGVCGHRVCVPLQEQLVLHLPPGEAHKSSKSALIATYAAKVPKE